MDFACRKTDKTNRMFGIQCYTHRYLKFTFVIAWWFGFISITSSEED